MPESNNVTSPIAIFAYNRPEKLKQTISALKRGDLASRSEVYIFCDGPKREEDVTAVASVRKYAETIDGFQNIHMQFAEENRGLAPSIISGVTKVLEKHGTVIVLEDDLLASPNFLNFMNQGLKDFSHNKQINSIAGYTVPITVPKGYTFDNYFTQRASSWGWATWKDRWDPVDWSVSDYENFLEDAEAKKRFNDMGSDMLRMLKKQMNGELSSWAIRWLYHQFRHDLYTVFPTVSKISNIGFGEEATHTSGAPERFATPIDTSGKEEFIFKHKPELDPWFVKQFISKYSLRTRIYYKIKSLLGLLGL